MSVIAARQAASAIGGVDNLFLGVASDGFQQLPIPYESAARKLTGDGALQTHFPVDANGRTIDAVQLKCFLHDYYYRIHISPSQLDLGNVVSAQTTATYVWNAWLEPKTLVSIAGLDEGILVSGQPDPPLLFPALKELVWQLTVTPDGQPVLDTVVAWDFSDGKSARVRVTANRIIGWTFVPDWGEGVTERLISVTDILQSESAVEQRRALRQAPRREFEAPMYVEGRERQYLDLALSGWSARTWALPIWHEIQLLGDPIDVGANFISCQTEHLDFRTRGLAMLRGESALISETVEVKTVQPNGLQLARGTQSAWPAGTRLYPVRSAVLLKEPTLTKLSDVAISADVRFLIVDPSDWPRQLPATTYRGRPVYAVRPDESEDLTRTLSRMLLTLDNGSAMPLYTDTAGRGLATFGHRWVELGRAARASLRSFIYAMNGRQKTVWVPTHSDDLELVDAVTEIATTIQVAYCGYTRFANGAPGRRDIRIELHDSSVFMRRITASTELSLEIEQLALDSALGRQVQPADIFRISWMSLCRFDSDTQEIQHQTDSEGVASWSTVFREVVDES